MATFRVGDDVEMVADTAPWTDYPHLREVTGRVTEIVDDGSGQSRISVVYPDGTPFVGALPELFEPTRSDTTKRQAVVS